MEKAQCAGPCGFRRSTIAWLASVFVACVWPVRAEVPMGQSFKLIVHASNRVRSVRRQDVASLYLNSTASWTANGLRAEPVEQSARSLLRQSFCRDVLAMDLSALQQYWIARMRETGERPPRTMSGDADVIAFVSGRPGAIGYVNARTPIPDTVRALSLQ
jgi:ABC-type phosphate transport system substrate-binding protein